MSAPRRAHGAWSESGRMVSRSAWLRDEENKDFNNLLLDLGDCLTVCALFARLEYREEVVLYTAAFALHRYGCSSSRVC